MGWRQEARAAGASKLTVERISPRTVLLSGAGGNVIATKSSAGLVVIDGGLAEQTESILSALNREFPATPIAWLFNTHWHREQTGLNETVGQRGGTLFAHENTRLWLATEYYVDWQDRTYAPLPKAAWPTRTFYGSDERTTVGGVAVQFGRLPNAHTDGDIYVHLVDEDILAVGGALTPGAYPFMDYATGGWLGGVVDASRVLTARATPATRVIAATGGITGKPALQAQLDLATQLRDRIVAGIKMGKSVQDLLDEGVTKEFDADFGDPRFFVLSSYRGLWGHIRELGIA